MITLLIVFAWLLSGLAVFRRVGYALEASAHGGHEFQSICSSCICKNCGDNWGHHYRFRTLSNACHNFEFKIKSPHARTMFSFVPVMVGWPLVVLVYLGLQAKARLGLESKAFFFPAPAIETREVKREREFAEREAQLAIDLAEVERREKELGIGGI